MSPSRCTIMSDSSSILRNCCLHCQFFNCENCINLNHDSKAAEIYSSLKHLPPCRIYYCSSYHSVGSFVVIRFREGTCETLHPAVESMLCSCEEKPILFVYLPQSLQTNSSVCSFLELLSFSQLVVIPITNKPPSLLRLEFNHLFKMQHSLPYSISLPSLHTPLLFPLPSPDIAENITPPCVSIPLPSQSLSDTEKLVVQLHKSLSSPMQRLSVQQQKVVVGAGFVVTQQMNGLIDWYYIPPHYAQSDEMALFERYKQYQYDE